MAKLGRRSAAWTGGLLAVASVMGAAGQAMAQAAPGAHVHGLGRLAFVADGGALMAELEAPLANLLGFERAPSSAAEQHAYDAALEFLSDPANVFDLPRAGCGVTAVTVHAPDFGADAQAHDHDHDHDHHAHDAHVDVRVDYEFQCESLSRLQRISVNLFARFPGFERIDAVFVGDRSATGALTPGNRTLELR